MLAVFKNISFNFTHKLHAITGSNFYKFEYFYSKYQLFSTLRKPFKSVESKDVIFFKTILDPSRVLTQANELDQYNIDWLKSYQGSSSVVLRPKNVDEVSKILAYCNENHLAICPQGGNTGVVCGSVPIFDEIIISMSLMNTVTHFDETTGILQCQAGCILENLENLVNEKNYTVPIDLAAKGSCHIGGNVATNAGGIHFIRYGSLHGNILGLKIVLANGEILNLMNTMRKNNTGYDLKHLFIGSEGTLGIITDVSILCYPKTSETAVAFLGCNTFKEVIEIVKVIRHKLSEVISSLEMLDETACDLIEKNLQLTMPISKHAFYILVEISGSNSVHNEEKLMDCMDILMKQKLVNDGTIATELSRIKYIWSIRERFTEAFVKEGYAYIYDISLPLENYYEIVEIMKAKLGTSVTCITCGHLGDGNVHFTAVTPKFDPNVVSKLEPFIYEWTSKRNGSISAEHGIGYSKRNYLPLNNTNKSIQTMKSIKNLFDPKGILNPYKVLP